MNKGSIVLVFVGIAIGLILVMGNMGNIGAGNVEYKETYSGTPTGIGADKIETKEAQRSIVPDDISTNKPETRETQNPVVPVELKHNTAQSTQINVGDLNTEVSDVFSSALVATTSWIDLMVLLAIVGIALSFVMGILFRVSRILGMG